MLEDIAVQYVNLPEESIRAISYGLVILGAVVAGISRNDNGALRRVPYFAYSGLLYLVSAASQMIWLESFSAMVDGYLWIFFSVDVVVALVVGYFFGVIAMARSRDAYGHGRLAALAFIPLANFWLLLTPSKNEMNADRTPTIPLLTGGMGVVSGFVMLAVGIGIGSYVGVEMNRRLENIDPSQQSAGLDFLIRTEGIDETLRQMAAEVPSQQIDETTTLLRVEGDGKTLRYLYEVTAAVQVLPPSMRTGLIQKNCDFELLRSVLEAGATLEHVYRQRDGSEVGTVTVTRQICGF
ncbi:MAG: hypothetical protein KUG70_14710 [Rhodobacteraceae bacterium]|nr:hypothetical protein [Paracoccaceae bacterium]